ncbi:MAG: SDR family oxidoreductase [Asticcacaulis sp.]
MTRWVMISGVSRGLGQAIATDLLMAGYNVAGCSTSHGEAVQSLQDQYAERFFWMACDMGDSAAIEAFTVAAVAHFAGAPWGVVNNAGMSVEGILSTLPLADIERVLQVNLTGAMALTRAALRRMQRTRQPGRIINISSITGLRGYTGLSAYAASKAGMDGFGRALSREVGRLGITVNSIAPGYMKTALSAGLDDRQLDQIVRRTPLGRLCELSDITPLVRFLLSEEAAFITGQTLTVDGGLTS